MAEQSSAALPGTTSRESDDDHYLKAEIYRRVQQEPALFDFLQAGCLDGLCYWDLEHPDHKWINPHFWQLLGYEPGEQPHLASVWKERVFEEDLAVAMENLERHTRDADHRYDQVLRYRHKNGSTVWMRCRGLVLHDERGRPTRMLGIHMDVTALKETEAELRNKKEQLERINAELSRFAYSASHDLQAPLNTISSHLNLLQKRAIDGDSDPHGLMDHVIAAAGRMKAVIGGLMDLARLSDVGEQATTVDCNRLLNELCSDLEHEIGESGATIEWDKLPDVRGVPSLLRQLFQNLISNAIKYHKPGHPPVISITVEGQGGHWRFSVADQGIGIEAEFHQGIFDLFKRLHTWSEIRGTGLGLPLCRKVVELHHGRLWVESEAGKGAIFRFTVPKITAEDG